MGICSCETAISEIAVSQLYLSLMRFFDRKTEITDLKATGEFIDYTINYQGLSLEDM